MARHMYACEQFFFISCLGVGLTACATSGDPTGDPDPKMTGSLGNTMYEDASRDRISFSIRVEGISGPQTLILPDGTATAAPISPGMMAVATIENALFKPGTVVGESGLQNLAEDGNPCPLVAQLAKTDDVSDAEFIIPNLHYKVIAKPGDRLHFAVMFVQSNDLFYAFGPSGLPLFDDMHRPVSGDMTQYVALWDAGTELNEAPGVGPNQAPRQPAPGVGTAERNPVELVSEVHDGFAYPPTENIIRVTVTPDI